MSIARRFADEGGEAFAALRYPVRLVAYGKLLCHRRALGRAYFGALLVLGQAMYAAGIDDGELGAQIVALDERISRTRRMWVSVRPLHRRRLKLFGQLGALALAEEGTLPGADVEYAKAREIQKEFQECNKQLNRAGFAHVRSRSWVF